MNAIISNFLAAILTLSAAAGSAMTSIRSAQNGDEWKNNTGVIDLDTMTVTGGGVAVDGNVIKITDGGDFNVSGTLSDGMIYVNSNEKVKLRLSGASITNSSGPAVFFDNAEKAFITITEGTENYLSDGKTYSTEDADAALFSNDDLEIKGDGSLNITANYKHGIAGDDDVSIENGIITVNSYEHGIKANDTLSVTGGNITVTSETGKGMKSDLEVVIDDGTLNVTSKQSEGIESKGTLTINGGDVTVNAADDGINTGNASSDTAQEGNFVPRDEAGKNADGQRGMRGNMSTPPDGMTPPDGNVLQNGELTPPDGNIQQNGEMTPPDGEMPHGGHMMNGDTPINGNMPQGGGQRGMMMDEETAAAHAITINGGKVSVSAEGDGIDSNGSLVINGGTVIVDGPSSSGNGPLDAEAGISMNGGTVITASSAGMLQMPTAAKGINSLQVFFDGTQNSTTSVSVKEKSTGKELASITPTKNFQAFLFASSELKTGTEYVVYINGAEYQTFTASEGVSTVGSASFGGFGGKGMGGRRGGNV